MPDVPDGRKIEQQAETTVADILRAAARWSKEVPAPLTPSIRAVCIRLAEMVADQRHYLAPLPEPQATARRMVLELVAERLRKKPVTEGIEKHLADLAQRELRATASWSLVANSQSEWQTTAIQYLEDAGNKLPPAERPDAYWGDDVVAGIIASVKAIIGADDLHTRLESQYGGKRPAQGEEQPEY